MVYKIKKTKQMYSTPDNYRTLYEDLDFASQQEYGSKYSELGKKEQLKIAKKLIEFGY